MTDITKVYSVPKPGAVFGRRRFVQGAAATGLLAGLAGVRPPAARAASGAAPELRGSSFELSVERLPVNFTGSPATAIAVNGSVPGPTLRWREGETVTLNVTNTLRTPTSIHWHGIRSPAAMDGVPGMSFAGIAPGETFTYRIPLRQAGTYWYHSHSGFQEQVGLYGAIIVEPRGGYAQAFDRDYVVLLSDWTDTSPGEVLSNLKFRSDYYDFHQRDARGFLTDAARNGVAATLADRAMWGRMRMSATDIADVTGATYTYLLNGQAPDRNWTGLFRPGERVRLRFINASSMSFFDVRVPGLEMTVVQADGNDVEPVTVDEFRIGVAETYDVIVRPTARAHTIFAQSEDRTGFARGTLAAAAGLAAPVPPMDPRPVRTMADMGMAMGGMAMGGMAGMEMPKATPKPEPKDAMHGMASMDDMPGRKMDKPASGTMNGTAGTDVVPAKPVPKPSVDLTGAVGVDNVAMAPADRLGDPGDGLQDSKRRVLTYRDLRATRPGSDRRPPSRDITLHLTGNMARYMWGFDGTKFSQSEPIRLARGERVRFTLVNDTMMEHPIHLHGLWSELENGQDDYRPYKHTVIVQPGSTLSYLVTADAPGTWAYHCHLLYHMETGMMRAVVVA